MTLAALVQTAAHGAGVGSHGRLRGGRQGRARASPTPAAAPTATVKLDVAAGPYILKIDVPTLSGSGVDATTTCAVHGGGQRPAGRDPGGPYSVLVSDPLPLDATRSFDPEARTVTVAWDLNNDDVFDDADGFDRRSRPRRSTQTRVRRRVPRPGVAFPITVRVTDDKGAEALASSTVTFTATSGSTVTPTTVTINPGGSGSLQVSVGHDERLHRRRSRSRCRTFPPVSPHAFSPPSVTPNGISLLTVTAAANASKLTTPIMVHGVSGAIAHDATGTVNVEFGLVPQCFTAIDVHVVDAETNAPLAAVSVSAPATRRRPTSTGIVASTTFRSVREMRRARCSSVWTRPGTSVWTSEASSSAAA